MKINTINHFATLTNWLMALFICILFTPNTLVADVIYDKKDQSNLSNLYVTSLAKDSTGFLWIGTSKGLNRWDGFKYKYFLSNKEDSLTISNNKIESLLITKNGTLWVATSNGLNRYNPLTETFTHYIHNPNDPNSILSNNILCMEEDLKGNLWIGTKDKGLQYFDLKKGTFKKIEFEKHIEYTENYEYIRTIFCDSKGVTWVGFNYSGIIQIDSTFQIQFHYSFNHNNKIEYIRGVNDICEARPGILMFATWGGKVIEYNTNGSNHFSYWKGNSQMKSNVAYFLKPDPDGNIWLTEDMNNISLYTFDGKLLDRYNTGENTNQIPSDQLSAILIDKTSIWIGTLNKGFFQIDVSPKPIKQLFTSHNNNGYSITKISSIIFKAPHEIIISTYNGEIFSYDEMTQQTTFLANGYTNISNIFLDKPSNAIWLADFSKSIQYVDYKSKKTVRIFEFPYERTLRSFQSNDSLVLMGTWGEGLFIWNRETEKLRIPGTLINEKRLTTLDMLLDGRYLWIASYSDGLVQYDLKTSTFKQFTLEKTTQSLYPTNQISLIKSLNDSTLVVFSADLGVCGFDKIHETFTPIGVNNGINELHLRDIEQDENGFTWFISDRKIIKADNHFTNITEFTVYDGVNYGIEHNASIFSPYSKRVYMGGQEGIQYFDTNNTIRTNIIPRVAITDFKIFGRSVNTSPSILKGKSIVYTDTIQLNHKENFITIEFASLQLKNSGNKIFSYKLEGLNDEWIQVLNENSVTYSNLKAGKYHFLVKSPDGHGIWSDQTTSLTIIITPPFWKTVWFTILSIILTLALIISLIKYREHALLGEKLKLEQIVVNRTREIVHQKDHIEHQKTKLEEANRIQNRFFGIIAHDLKNPTGSIVQILDLIENAEQFDLTEEKKQELIHVANQSAQSLLNLLEELLLWGRSQSDSIEFIPEKLSLFDLVNNEIDTLLPVANNKKIKLENIISTQAIAYADPNSIRTVIRNLLTNALKFSHPNTTITIGNQENDHDMIIYVQDHGVGISPTNINQLFKTDEKLSTTGTSGESGTGLGLNLCLEFVHRNGGQIWVKSELGKGSRFNFTLPKYTEDKA